MIDLITLALAKKAGGGSVSDYAQLMNKPSINGVTLMGNKSSETLGLGKYEIELLVSQDMRHLTDIKHGNTSLTFAEFKAAVESRSTEIYLNYSGQKVTFHPQVVSDDRIDLVSVTFSPFTNLMAAIWVAVDSDYSDSSIEFIDIENTQTRVGEQTAPRAITLADNTEYYLANVSDLALTYPAERFECWMRITTATSGTITITLPISQYIGDEPTFGNSETWEISVKDGVVVAQKVGA